MAFAKSKIILALGFKKPKCQNAKILPKCQNSAEMPKFCRNAITLPKCHNSAEMPELDLPELPKYAKMPEF